MGGGVKKKIEERIERKMKLVLMRQKCEIQTVKKEAINIETKKEMKIMIFMTDEEEVLFSY